MGLLTVGLLAAALIDAKGDQALLSVQSSERAGLYAKRDRRGAVAASRTAWLERNASQRSFPCGVVRASEEGADDLSLSVLRGVDLELPVTAAILADDVVFLAEPPAGTGVDVVLEAGRIARGELGDVDVVDAMDAHVPEPAVEGFEDPSDVWLVLRWGDGPGADEERFLFRSTWLAWQAARRLREAATRP